jgi:hypothetical protein
LSDANTAAAITADMATSSPASPLLVPPAASTNGTGTLVLQDLKPPVPILNPWPYALAAGVLAALVAFLLGWLLRERRRRRQAPPPLVLVPPHRRASDRLHAALALIQDPKAFITEVANTLRTYLEERFDLRAPERTTEEFLQELPRCPALHTRQTELLADFLTRCDLVKFARHEPTEPELRGLWQTAHQLVTETSSSVEGTRSEEATRGKTETDPDAAATNRPDAAPSPPHATERQDERTLNRPTS